jgi:ferredoxin-NADP reductase
MAAGIGVTAVRSLLEDLPRSARPVVLLRASTAEDLVLADEVTELVKKRAGTLHTLTGNRTQARIDQRSLPRLVPDFQRRDTYVCGPEGFVADMVTLLRSLDVPDDAIHSEMFAI